MKKGKRTNKENTRRYTHEGNEEQGKILEETDRGKIKETERCVMRDFHANQRAVQFSSKEFNQEKRKSSQCVNLD